MKNSVGENHWQLGEALMNFGTFKQQKGEYQKSEEMFRQAYDLYEVNIL